MVHQCQCKIGASLLGADMANLAGEAGRVMAAGGDYLHLDVMDGHFVPNITMGPPVIKALRKHSTAFFDCHMMVSEPEKWVAVMADAGCDQFTFHLESTKDPLALIALIKSHNMKVGIAIKPGTSVDTLMDVMNSSAAAGTVIDMALIMTVEPGFGAQKFMPDMMPKVQTLRSTYPTLDIEVDGGINTTTIDVVAKAGANMIVSGSALFAGDISHTIAIMKASVQLHGNGQGPTATAAPAAKSSTCDIIS